jgi:hypothetical protein
MKADFSNWSLSPDNFVALKRYAESAIVEELTRGKIPIVVWRDGQFTLTLSPLEGEQVYEIGIADPRPVEEVDLGFEPIPDEEEEEEEEMEEVIVRVKKKKPSTLL